MTIIIVGNGSFFSFFYSAGLDRTASRAGGRTPRAAGAADRRATNPWPSIAGPAGAAAAAFSAGVLTAAALPAAAARPTPSPSGAAARAGAAFSRAA